MATWLRSSNLRTDRRRPSPAISIAGGVASGNHQMLSRLNMLVRGASAGRRRRARRGRAIPPADIVTRGAESGEVAFDNAPSSLDNDCYILNWNLILQPNK